MLDWLSKITPETPRFIVFTSYDCLSTVDADLQGIFAFVRLLSGTQLLWNSANHPWYEEGGWFAGQRVQGQAYRYGGETLTWRFLWVQVGAGPS
jgi:hypothetical protein